MKREDLKVGEAMTFDDAHQFLLEKLPAADADNMIRFIRGQEARKQDIAVAAHAYGYSDGYSDGQNSNESNPVWSFNQHIDQINSTPVGWANNGWISVDERLPVEWETVLLNTDDGVQVGTLELSANGENFFINDCDDGTMVYHWHPLPPAPEQPK